MEFAIGDYVETGDGVIGVIERIDAMRVAPLYTVVDSEGESHQTFGVALVVDER